MPVLITLSPCDYDAVLFDLDGVLTPTASVHAAAWKRLFDEFLEHRSQEARGAPFVAFDIDSDYRRYVDGKPRLDGVSAFLKARSIAIPHGAPDDKAGFQSIHALGRRKDEYFLSQLERHGVAPYAPAVALVRALRDQRIKTAVVSSSINGIAVLEAARIDTLFDVVIDGKDISRLALAGKPAPDAFLAGAKRLDVDPSRAVVVEDAIVGVQAGRAGGFGCIIGVDRHAQSHALSEAGADVVVTNLAQVSVAVRPPSTWSLVFEGFDPSREGVREALCTLGNGYFATRAAAPWALADEVHYPGVYLAGGYNRLCSDIAGRVVQNEDLVNFPSWLAFEFQAGGAEWFDLRAVKLLSYRQELDLRRGMLLRTVHYEDREGRRSLLKERRFVSMANQHLAAMEISLTAENWSGRVTVRSSIDGRIVNSGAKLYRRFNQAHLQPLGGNVVGADAVGLLVQTTQSRLQLAEQARTQTFVDGRLVDAPREAVDEPGRVGQQWCVDIEQGETLSFEKLAAVHSSRDRATSQCEIEARKTIERAGRFSVAARAHEIAWKHLWQRFDVNVEPAESESEFSAPMLLRLNMFHLLQTVSFHSIDLDIGVPPRGWTGEAYQGHVFWDELFIFPFFNYRVPEITRALLMYRYRRLGEARAAAQSAGFKGAMFPWQSGSDGREETQKFNLNPRSQRWVRDDSYLQRHVGSAIAYNVWQYFQVTRDIEFLQFHGAELIIDIARFWASIASFNEGRQRFEIHGVMGPDEFHDAYPGAPTPGLRNNAYTNLMAVWVLCRALETIELLSEGRRAELMEQIGLSTHELARWDEISRKMFVPFQDDGIISQFEGYENLLEFDWPEYEKRYGNIQRLDLILEAENDSANRYKVAKQADVLMLFYLFSSEELGELFRRLDYPFEFETIPKNVSYYAARTSHGSTLCRVVLAWVLARSDRLRAMRFFAEALQSDIADIQQGTTAEGVHLGAMAGTVDLIQRGVTGIEVKDDCLRLNPKLPAEVERLNMNIRYRGHSIELHLTQDRITVRGGDSSFPPVCIWVDGVAHEWAGDTTRTFMLDSSDPRSAATPDSASETTTGVKT